MQSSPEPAMPTGKSQSKLSTIALWDATAGTIRSEQLMNSCRQQYCRDRFAEATFRPDFNFRADTRFRFNQFIITYFPIILRSLLYFNLILAYYYVIITSLLRHYYCNDGFIFSCYYFCFYILLVLPLLLHHYCLLLLFHYYLDLL